MSPSRLGFALWSPPVGAVHRLIQLCSVVLYRELRCWGRYVAGPPMATSRPSFLNSSVKKLSLLLRKSSTLSFPWLLTNLLVASYHSLRTVRPDAQFSLSHLLPPSWECANTASWCSEPGPWWPSPPRCCSHLLARASFCVLSPPSHHASAISYVSFNIPLSDY